MQHNTSIGRIWLIITAFFIFFTSPNISFAFSTFPIFSTAVDSNGYLIGTTTFSGGYNVGHDPSGTYNSHGVYMALKSDFEANYNYLGDGCNTGTQAANGYILSEGTSGDAWSSIDLGVYGSWASPYLASTLPVGWYAFWANDYQYCAGSGWAIKDLLYVFWDGSSFSSSQDTTTHISLVYPYNGQTGVSSTSPLTLDATGYIESKYTGDLTGRDAVDNANKNGIRVKWNIYSNVLDNNCIDVICAVGGGIGGIDYFSDTGYTQFPVNNFSVSTSTGENLKTGFYTLKTSVVMPSKIFGLSGIFGFSFGYDNIISTTTTFTVGAPTAGQTALNDLYGALKIGNDLLTGTSSEVSLSSCNPLSLDLGLCLSVLFLPSTEDLRLLMQYAHDNFLTRAPWGYATRMVSILTNNATSTVSSALPTWVVTFPSIQGDSGSPLAGHTLTFDMQDMLNNGSSTLNSITDPISGKTIREIVEPWILLFIAISALIIMFHDIMGMGKHTNKYADK